MSNSNNLGKELKRLRKELDQLEDHSANRKFVFIVLQPGEDEETKKQSMIDGGKLRLGDDYQVVQWHCSINELKGAEHIPEGNTKDPFADPYAGREGDRGDRAGGGLPSYAGGGAYSPGSPVDPSPIHTANQLDRWRQHERKIEADGQRYDPDKPKHGGGIY